MFYKLRKAVIFFILSGAIFPLGCTESTTEKEPIHADENSIRPSRRLLGYTYDSHSDTDFIFYILIPMIIGIIYMIMKCCQVSECCSDVASEDDSRLMVHPPPRTFSNPPSVPVPNRGNPLRPPRTGSSVPIIPGDTQRQIRMVHVISIENPNYFERAPEPEPKPSDDLPPSYDSIVRVDERNSQRMNYSQRY